MLLFALPPLLRVTATSIRQNNRILESPRIQHYRKKSEEDSSESCKLEACKQAKIVLCVLSSACRLSLQISPKIQGLLYKVAFRIYSLKLIILPRQYRIQDYSKHCRAGQSSKLNWAYFDGICVKAKSAY